MAKPKEPGVKKEMKFKTFDITDSPKMMANMTPAMQAACRRGSKKKKMK